MNKINNLAIAIMFIALTTNADSSHNENATTKRCQNALVHVCKDETVIVVKKKAKKAKIKKVKVAEAVAQPKVVTKIVTKIVKESKQNIISIFGQRRIINLKASAIGPSAVKVEAISGPVVGLLYQRITESGLALGAGLDSQADVIITVGIGF